MGTVVTLHADKLPAPEALGKVAVLMGGWSSEREVSLNSGRAVLQALLDRKVDAVGIDVSHETVLADLQSGGFDRAFNILHGGIGENGTLQGALEVMNLPYTGSGVMASAIAMDKFRTKQLLGGAALPTPKYMLLDDDTDLNYVIAELGLPLMVKPALEGSSIGMSKVEEEEQIFSAYELAAQFDGLVFAEQWVTGDEYTVAVLGEQALPVIRLETPNKFYDYEAKYVSNDTQYHCPSGLDEEHEARLQRLALSTFKSIGAEGWGRVDIICDQNGKPYIIELNTVPGMTDHSLVPMAAKASGIEFTELVYRILVNSLENKNSGLNKEGTNVSSR